MKNQPNSKKSTIGIIIIIVMACLAYYFFTKGNSAPEGALVQQSTPQADAVSARILSLLNQVSKLEIDTSIFEDVVYMTFKDRSIQIPPVEVGRPNPFAPIPGVVEASTGGAAR
ncbi:MAG: hypothetical protein RLY66_599 [Candidatus Parcubacteria bacterium]|jgi:hypothetical protein